MKRETKEIKEIREIREIKETSVHRVYKASRDPKASLVKKAIQVTLVNKVLLVCKAHLACRDRGCRAFGANKVYRAPQESQAPSGLQEHLSSVLRDRLVLIVVLLVVARPILRGKGSR